MLFTGLELFAVLPGGTNWPAWIFQRSPFAAGVGSPPRAQPAPRARPDHVPPLRLVPRRSRNRLPNPAISPQPGNGGVGYIAVYPSAGENLAEIVTLMPSPGSRNPFWFAGLRNPGNTSTS